MNIVAARSISVISEISEFYLDDNQRSAPIKRSENSFLFKDNFVETSGTFCGK
jgi:hypothetical protein